MTVVLDLDGVLWLADRAIPGAPEAVARLRAGGHRVVFVSNNSFATVADVEAQLAGFGIPAENLVTQGYGEQYLKIQTQEANRLNRRVAVRPIGSLLAGKYRN